MAEKNKETSGGKKRKAPEETYAMKIHYIEIVTPEVEPIVEKYSALYNVEFKEGDPMLGGARTIKLDNGGMMGIRPPMHDKEKSVTRNYVLVKDIEASVNKAKELGAEIAVPPMEIPGHGHCAIIIHDGGQESGFWQL